jgi:hypothetical protein
MGEHASPAWIEIERAHGSDAKSVYNQYSAKREEICLTDSTIFATT